ncbi:Choline kinase [hydrothermal vent metagenome]|uniref:Choline kinase n=1 Tax=hydrothermal vent metagenome TaxID=652676 RepID=A0A3B0TD42_9ZZZZ
MNDAEAIAAGLPCWTGPVRPVRLEGGISNDNFLIEDEGQKFVVRVNGDVPEHGVLRINDANCNRAAAAVGVAPAVRYAAPNAMVVEFIDGRTLAGEDICDQKNLERFLPVLKRTHTHAFRQLRGPVCAFWPFRVCRDYAFFLEESASRQMHDLARLRDINERLEASVGAFTPVLGHNDLLAANFIDDGTKIWLIDWEHAGLTSPLFDLANLSANNGLTEAQDRWLLETYFERPLDDELAHRFGAMKCASLLREAMWGMVSEITSKLEFDFAAYSAEHLTRFNAEYTRL